MPMENDDDAKTAVMLKKATMAFGLLNIISKTANACWQEAKKEGTPIVPISSMRLILDLSLKCSILFDEVRAMAPEMDTIEIHHAVMSPKGNIIPVEKIAADPRLILRLADEEEEVSNNTASNHMPYKSKGAIPFSSHHKATSTKKGDTPSDLTKSIEQYINRCKNKFDSN